MMTVNAVYSQISENLPKNSFYDVKKDEGSIDNNISFEDVINGVMNSSELNTLDSIDAALQLTAKNYGVPYSSLKNRLNAAGDFNENAKSFLYGVALASSALNTQDQTNIVLNAANYATNPNIAPINYSTALYNIGTGLFNNTNYGQSLF